MLSGLKQQLDRLDKQMQGLAVAAVRVLVALLWMANLHWKVPPHFGEDTGGGLFKYSASVSRNSTFAPFTWVTEHVVLPNFGLFGWLTLATEISLAMLLLIGYRTKLVALLGAGMAVPIMLSVLYYDRADEWSWSYLLMIGVHILLYATDAGTFFGLDGTSAGHGVSVRRGLIGVGAVGSAVGVLGLFVARSMDFAGDRVALLGSDAGFVDGDKLVRRWELKFLWFNPLWALLTIAFGVLIVLGTRQLYLAYVGAVGYGLIGVTVLFMQTFSYVRDNGQGVQTVGTGSNVAFWGALCVGGAVLARRLQRAAVEASIETVASVG